MFSVDAERRLAELGIQLPSPTPPVASYVPVVVTGEEGVQLAEVNIALPRATLDAPAMAGFVRAVDDVNWLAERSPGFMWRRRPDEGPVVLAPFECDETRRELVD